MDSIKVIAYGGIALLVLLLLIFEVKDLRRNVSNFGYEFYTTDGKRLRIRPFLCYCYKVYVFSACPVSTKRDRLGEYFMVKARSSAEAEAAVDNIYSFYEEENNESRED